MVKVFHNKYTHYYTPLYYLINYKIYNYLINYKTIKTNNDVTLTVSSFKPKAPNVTEIADSTK